MFRILAIVLVSFGCLLPAAAEVKVQKTEYKGWKNCYRVSNGEVELIVTTDVGPRVIRYGFVGGQNLFKEFTEQIGKSGESAWQARGGHRLWMAPEDAVLTYALDNTHIQAQVKNDVIELTGNVEKETVFQKQITIRLAATGSAVEVTHRITNKGVRPREFAPWTLTMM